MASLRFARHLPQTGREELLPRYRRFSSLGSSPLWG